MKKTCFITGVILLFYIHISAVYVTDISISGNINMSESVVLSASQIHLGDDINSEKIDNAIKSIYKLGFFQNVKIDIIPNKDNQCEVNIIIVEYPIIKDIDFKGTGVIKKKSLKDDYSLNIGSVASDKNLFHWKRDMEKKYIEKGFLNVSINLNLVNTDTLKNTTTLQIAIIENQKIILRDIVFEGNHNIKSVKLAGVMKNKPRKGIFFWRGRFDEEKFEEDKVKIVEYYADNGFPFAKVEKTYSTFDEKGKNMILHIVIDESDKIYFGKIDLKGNEVFKSKYLEKLFKIEEGKLYNRKNLDKTIQNLYEIYGNKGYLFLQVIPKKKVEGNNMNITLQIVENFPAYLRYINIAGNTKTHENVIRREMTIFPGELLKRARLIETQRKLAQLNYFEDLSLDTRIVDDSGNVDLTFKVKEKSTETVSGGVGYSQVDGITGNISLSFQNLLGTGRKISLQFDKGRTLNNFQLSFSEPWLFDTKASLGSNIFYTTRSVTYTYDSLSIDTTVIDSTTDSTTIDSTHTLVPFDVNENTKGFSITAGKYIQQFRYLKGFIGYTLQNTDFYTTDTAHVNDYIKAQLGNKWKSAVSLTCIRDSREKIFNPVNGSFARLSSEFVGGPFFGDEHFQKYTIDGRYYRKIIGIVSIMTRGVYGTCFGYKTPGDVPLLEKFLIGGVGDLGLRGYSDRSIGFNNMSGYQYAGRAYFISNIELHFQANDNIYAIGFFDIGNVWSSFSDGFNKRFWPMKKGAGVGIRLEVPMIGILGFDYGYGFDRSGGGMWEPHIQIGTTF